MTPLQANEMRDPYPTHYMHVNGEMMHHKTYMTAQSFFLASGSRTVAMKLIQRVSSGILRLGDLE
jgi:hypothetical protein